jgi:ATP/maltotriose-dependent transcriptional regulator MalT
MHVALETLEPVVTHYRSEGDAVLEARALVEREQARFQGEAVHGSEQQVALTNLEEALRRFTGAAPEVRVPLLLVVARFTFLQGDDGRTLSAATEAEELARKTGNRSWIIEAMFRRAGATASVIGRRAAADVYRKAITLIDGSVSSELVANVMNNYAYSLFELGDNRGNAEYRARAADIARTSPQIFFVAFAVTMHGQARFYLGDMAEARALVAESVAMLDGAEQTWYTNYVLMMSACMSFVEADLAGAINVAEQVHKEAVMRNDPQLASWSSWELVFMLTAAGRPDAALAVAESAAACCLNTSSDDYAQMALAWSEAHAGRPGQAVERSRRIHDDQLRMHNIWGARSARLVLGAALDATGDASGAETELRSAIGDVHDVPEPWLEGLMWAELARSRARVGDVRGAEGARAAVSALVLRHGMPGLRLFLDRPLAG